MRGSERGHARSLHPGRACAAFGVRGSKHQPRVSLAAAPVISSSLPVRLRRAHLGTGRGNPARHSGPRGILVRRASARHGTRALTRRTGPSVDTQTGVVIGGNARTAQIAHAAPGGARANGLDATGPKSAVVERLLPLGRTVLPAGGGGLFAASLSGTGDIVPSEGGRGDDAVRADAGNPVGASSGDVGGSGHA